MQYTLMGKARDVMFIQISKICYLAATLMAQVMDTVGKWLSFTLISYVGVLTNFIGIIFKMHKMSRLIQKNIFKNTEG
jgi:hypothetical protein